MHRNEVPHVGAQMRERKKFIIESGWLVPVRRQPSANYDERPDGAAVELLVIHGISLPTGEFGGPWIDDLLTNRLDPAAHSYFREFCMLRVSALVLIRRDGEVVQYVSFDHRAWHAGQSCFAGRERCNDFSIGIELEGCDDRPYDDAQYISLAAVTRALMQRYPAIDLTHIAATATSRPATRPIPA